MQSADANNFTDPEISDYLLGVAIDENRTEKIDELIFLDEGFGTRVNAIERDLIDEYIRNELDAETRRRFEDHYLRSPSRRERVRLAGAIGEFAAPAMPRAEAVRTVEIEQSGGGWPWWKFAIPAFAVAILLAVAVPLWLNSGTTQQQANINSNTNSNQLAQIQPTPELSPSAEPTASPAASGTPTNQSGPPANENRRVAPPAPRIFALTLMPQTRGSQGGSTVTVPSNTDRVSITIRLEPTEFSSLLIELRDQSSGAVIWRSNARPSRVVGGYQSVQVNVNADLLKGGNYAFRASAAGRGTEREIVGDYPFSIVR